MDDAEAIKYLDALMLKLSEHFDNCQIFVSKNPINHNTSDTEAGDTVIYNNGFGNWHARRGQVRQWLLFHEEQDAEYARRKCD